MPANERVQTQISSRTADRNTPVGSENDEPVNLGNVRAQREALRKERRRQRARDSLTAEAPDYGREIPPRFNPDFPDMNNTYSFSP